MAPLRVDDSRSLPNVDLKHQTGPSVATAHVAYPAATAAKAGAFGTACGKSAQGTAYVPYP